MKLNQIKKEMKYFVENADWKNVAQTNSTHKIHQFFSTLIMIERLKSLDIFPTNMEEFKEIERIRDSYPWGQEVMNIPNAHLNVLDANLMELKEKAALIYNSLSYVAEDENPYIFNIKLSKEIKSIESYECFNKKTIKLLKAISLLEVDGKVICDVEFAGFEKGSDIFQYIISNPNSIDIDTIYSYLTYILDVAIKWQKLIIGFYGVKIAKNIFKKNLLEAVKDVDKVVEESKKDFLKEYFKNENIKLLDKIPVEKSKLVFNAIIDILEDKNEITPSLSAPEYIDMKDGKIKIDYTKLEEVENEKEKPKSIEDKTSKGSKND